MIVGAQWGDEGKGKIVDLLAQHSDLVCRYQGGPNAGHTIVVGGETYKIRQIPSGILPARSASSAPAASSTRRCFVGELDELEARGISTGCVHVSGNAHLIMPWHVAIDRRSERRLGKLQIGTTRRGIGPAYADKASRLGIRVQDLLDPKILRQKIEVALAEKNLWLERVYGAEPLELEEVAARYEALRAAAAAVRRRHVAARRPRAARRTRRAARGRAGRRCSTSTTARIRSSRRRARSPAAAATGIGIGPNRIDAVIGVAKAYVTRVGEGPFPTEIEGADQERVRELGGEFGTVTGRDRRCGWLDLVALRYAVRLNGITSLALTKLDVLSAFDGAPGLRALPAARRRRRRRTSRRTRATSTTAARSTRRCRAGRSRSTRSTELDDLPDAARSYVEFVERELEVPVSLIGTGAERERVLAPGPVEALARP